MTNTQQIIVIGITSTLLGGSLIPIVVIGMGMALTRLNTYFAGVNLFPRKRGVEIH